MKKFLLYFSVAAALLSTLAGCGEGKKKTNTDELPYSYSPFVEGFTSGRVSRFTPIYLVFNQDVPPGTITQSEFAKRVKISPSAAGELTFENSRTIVFKPAEGGLKRDTRYTVTADLSDWFDTGKQNKDFQFRFITYPLELRASFESISIDESGSYTVVVSIISPDTETPETVQSLIAVSEKVSTSWEHSGDGREHTLTLTDIAAGEKKRRIDINVASNKLGVEEENLLQVTIPGKNDFTVYGIAFLSEPSRHVEVTFTEQLDENQDLSGIAFIEDNKSEVYAVSDNKLRLYPDEGRTGTLSVFLGGAIKSRSGLRLGEDIVRQVDVNTTRPSVRFVGNGVIIPQSGKVSVPFQTVNLRGVIVRVIKIFENNMGQFLQENTLAGYSDLTRVGRLIASKVIFLDEQGGNLSQWNTYAVDLASMVEPEPGAVYRVELSYNYDLSAYPCDGKRKSKEQIVADNDARFKRELERFDRGYYYSQNFDFNWDTYDYYESGNPCNPTYYYDKYVGRNVLASDLGVIAKRGESNEMTVLVHSLISTAPVTEVEVKLYNYQNQEIGRGVTNDKGRAVIAYASGRPYYIIASHGRQRGYLHVNEGNSLSMSDFDVSGEVVQRGVKGFIYGERGVWRPGDTIHLGFMLNDRSDRLPADHPVTLELHNPLGQLYYSHTLTTNELGLYAFNVPTEADVPTGAWEAKVIVGGVSFSKRLRVETIKPNRLKIDLQLPESAILGGVTTKVPLYVEWLQGATARNLAYEIEGSFVPVKTRFDKFPGYAFDDPSRIYSQEPVMLDEGETDDEGRATVEFKFAQGKLSRAPGMMNVNLVTRVFEASGDFSIDGSTVAFSPYKVYVGINSPHKGREQLNTGTSYIYDLAAVDYEGKPMPDTELNVEIFKVEWYWWWNSDNGSLAEYVSNSYNKPVKQFTAKTNAKGEASFNLNFPNNDWGTYFIRVRDKEGGHAAGVLSYFDWPYSYGRRDTEGSNDAVKLVFSADKESYAPGDKMNIVFPSSKGSRAVVSIENGTKVLYINGVVCSGEETTVQLDVTADMQPNAYVSVTLLQPHGVTANDMPIRMYGVIPVFVTSPESRLNPVIGVADELRPEAKYEVSVSEKNGRQMSYTLAIVDEGLLDLTKFRTPDPWKAFNAREALGVSTWDMYSYVMGAYGGRIERIFSIGGDDEAGSSGESRKTNRFAPVVQFDGPFLLKKGETRKHSYTMPNYNGRVRVMVVAGDGSAYGNAEKSVMVRKPVMLLGTLPRVIGVNEEMVVPATVFATEKGVGKVQVSIETSGNMSVRGASTTELDFSAVGDKQAPFTIAVGSKPGTGTVRITAVSRNDRSVYETDIEIRSVRRPQTKVQSVALEPGKSWRETVKLPGADGTNSLTLEMSDIQPVNLASRVGFLLGYPHGCIEQIVSRAFPQVYLWQFTSLTPDQDKLAQEAVKETIRRMRSYQNSEGAFSYWPGGGSYYDWATVYATHFMLEAATKGYLVPDAMKRDAIRNLSRAAKSWRPVRTNYYGRSEEYTQAYRLFVLTLSGNPEIGAMNRLRESEKLDAMSRWALAAAYARSGRNDVARTLIKGADDLGEVLPQYDLTFGSSTRDRAMQLLTLVALDDAAGAAAIVNEISKELGSDVWMSTQTTAFALMSIAEYMNKYKVGGKMDFSYKVGAKSDNVQTTHNIWNGLMFEKGAATAAVELKNNGKAVAFARIITEGVPEQGSEDAYSRGLDLKVTYYDTNGHEVDLSSVSQGTTISAEATVKNTSGRAINNVVLSQIMPAGWEILNTRFVNESEQDGSDNSDSDAVGVSYQDFRDDRVFSYIDRLPAAFQVTVKVGVMAVYPGTFYLPPVYVEAMYDNLTRANTKGRQTVVK